MRDTPAQPPSSAMTTLRALVMLACLLGIPFIAFKNTAVGDLARQFVIEKLGGKVQDTESREHLDEAPLFTAQGSAPNAPFSQASASPPLVSVPSRLPQQSAPTWENSSPQPSTGLSQSPSSPPLGPGGSINTAPPTHQTPGVPHPQPQTIGPLASSTTPQNKPEMIDHFRFIQERLRLLGANYYLLESWGDQGEHYRFHCRVSVGGSANFTKLFESTDQDPLRAMTQVLADVETWRRGSPALSSSPPDARSAPVQTTQLPTQRPAQIGSPPGYIR